MILKLLPKTTRLGQSVWCTMLSLLLIQLWQLTHFLPVLLPSALRLLLFGLFLY